MDQIKRMTMRLPFSLFPAACCLMFLAGCGDKPKTDTGDTTQPPAKNATASDASETGASANDTSSQSTDAPIELKFSYDYKDTESFRLGSPLWKHGAAITAITMIPQGIEIASAGGDRTIRVFDAETGFQLVSFDTTNNRPILDVCYDTDGNYLMAVDDQEYFYRYNFDNKLVGAFDGRGYRVRAARIKPAFNLLITGNYDREVKVWDIAAKSPIFTVVIPGDNPIAAVDISPDSMTVAVGDTQGACHFYDLKSGRPLASTEGSYRRRIGGMAFTPSGDKIAVSRIDGSVVFYDAHTFKKVDRVVAGGWGKRGIVFSPDGRRMALNGGANKSVVIFELQDASGNAVALPSFSESTVNLGETSVTQTISPSVDERIPVERGETLPNNTPVCTFLTATPPNVSGSWVPPATLKRPPVLTGTWKKIFEYERGDNAVPVSIAFHPKGQPLIVIGYGNGNIVGLDARNGKVLFQPKDSISRARDLAMNPDGTVLAVAHDDGIVRLWNPKDKTLIKELDPAIRGGFSATCLSMNRDGSLLAVGGQAENADCLIYDANTGRRLYRLIGHHGRVIAVTFLYSGDNNYLASIGDDNTFRVWSLSSGVQKLSVPVPVQAAQFLKTMPTGDTVIIGTALGTLAVLDETGKLLAEKQFGRGPIAAMAFSPDKTSMAMATSEKKIRILNTNTFDEIAAFDFPDPKIAPVSISFAADDTLVLANALGELITIDPKSGKRIGADQKIDQRLYAMLPGEDGASLYLATGDGTVIRRPYFKKALPTKTPSSTDTPATTEPVDTTLPPVGTTPATTEPTDTTLPPVDTTPATTEPTDTTLPLVDTTPATTEPTDTTLPPVDTTPATTEPTDTTLPPVDTTPATTEPVDTTLPPVDTTPTTTEPADTTLPPVDTTPDSDLPPVEPSADTLPPLDDLPPVDASSDDLPPVDLPPVDAPDTSAQPGADAAQPPAPNDDADKSAMPSDTDNTARPSDNSADSPDKTPEDNAAHESNADTAPSLVDTPPPAPAVK